MELGGQWAVKKGIAAKKNYKNPQGLAPIAANGNGNNNGLLQEVVVNGAGYNNRQAAGGKKKTPGKLKPLNKHSSPRAVGSSPIEAYSSSPVLSTATGRRSLSTERESHDGPLPTRRSMSKSGLSTGRPGSSSRLPPIKGARRTSLAGLAASDDRMPTSRTPPPVIGSTKEMVAESVMVSHTPDPMMPHHDDIPVLRKDRSKSSNIGGSGQGMSDGEETDAEGMGAGEKKGKKRRIRVVCRKRPLPEDCLDPENEDCVQVATGGEIGISAAKLRVDLSEYMESHNYQFDDAFDEKTSNESVYANCARSLIDTVFDGGSASCFAYGQTGSGKTHTMIGTETEPGLYILAANDIFERAQPHHRIFVSLYEIYCNSLFDLLNHRAVVVPREDANKRVNVCGLTWHEITSVKDLIRVIDRGTIQRRTGSTSANEFSSRSHAVLTITLRDETSPKFFGSLNVVDLAGSERAADTANNDKQTRLEGAEINKSLLALKECIRGLDERKKHIPFRGSKLTEVLRDNFVGNSQTVMVATISARAVDIEHTLNTLRYAFRVKGLSVEMTAPSKERYRPPPKEAPTPTPAQQAGTGAEDAKKKEGKKKTKDKKLKKHHHSALRDITPRTSSFNTEKAMADLENIIETRLASKFEELASVLTKKDTHIDTLVEQNKKLMEQNEELKRLMTYQHPTLTE